nr:hypothetical protein [Tanacetum cinerariifolium]
MATDLRTFLVKDVIRRYKSSRFGSKVPVVVGIIVRISVVVGASAVTTDGGEDGGVYSCDRILRRLDKIKILGD